MPSRPLIIGLVGGSGSGKTTVARAILAELGGVDAAFIDQDSYYKELHGLPLEERARVNFDHRDSLDNDLLAAHLQALANGVAIDKPPYDFAHHTRAEAVVRVEPKDVVLVDGILLFVDVRIRRVLDIKIFVDVPDDVRFIRRLQRDVAARCRPIGLVIA